jgi:hypothetical protein
VLQNVKKLIKYLAPQLMNRDKIIKQKIVTLAMVTPAYGT